MIILKLLLIMLLTLFILAILRLVAGVFKVMSFLRAGFQSPFDAQASSRNKHRHDNNSANPQSTMVKCASCDLYILDSEAISRNGIYYCCKEHARNQ